MTKAYIVTKVRKDGQVVIKAIDDSPVHVGPAPVVGRRTDKGISFDYDESQRFIVHELAPHDVIRVDLVGMYAKE
jgi:hypothetical protein